MTEEIDIKKDCKQCLFENECEIKELDTTICVWFLDKEKYEIIKDQQGSLYIEEVKYERHFTM